MLKWRRRADAPSNTAPEEIPALDPDRLPQHVAVIMDGNRRWAKSRGVPRPAGHRAGVESLRTMIRACTSLGIPMLTAFAFSTENWERPRDEVDFLMHLLDEVLEREFEELHQNGVRIRVIGSRIGLGRSTLRSIESAEEKTRDNKVLQLNVAWNYGGRAEICAAARELATKVANGELDPDSINEELFASHLQTGTMPDPDLLIRTGGEYRISNFLLWQLAYAELWVTPVHWPDFTEALFRNALADYQRRERRFGGV